MNRASPEEIEAVVGHEMGHYVLNHIYKGVLAVGLLVVIGFVLWRYYKKHEETLLAKAEREMARQA